MNIDSDTNSSSSSSPQQPNYNEESEQPTYDNEQDSYDDDDDDDSDDDDCGANHEQYQSERLLIYADKFIRNELLTIMEYIKNRDKDQPAEEVVVHEIYL
ncbi:hypothetical protein SAMD00019534_072640 [Acytostelium subglobosum LB1]|uniref:hypothetical protein n=1 Tax=Acytostelium subglobosum LB1 TaxID=1410327 RepID=UPI000644A05F|nr:hypothetical protein SAMD00019534_072640 [Acytostelium subglobosum LB1]GAM24089.1 hypothetical protein SAMD00019534_072640 [Acytostelium subglobosum LB1]|eukprot:XP_012753125.1 hypothetical protein SAMD00019534_072640 [Acytostelium subglobosum LB1]